MALLSIVKAQHGLVWSSTGIVMCGCALVLRSVAVHGTGNARSCVVLAKPIKAKRDDVKVELSFVGRCFVQYGTGAVRSSTVQVLFCFVGSRLGFAKCRQRNVWYG